MAGYKQRRRNIDFPGGNGGSRIGHLSDDDDDDDDDIETHIDPDGVEGRLRGEESGNAIVTLSAELGGQNPDNKEDLYFAAQDAITNIMHFAAAQGFDVANMMRIAGDHFDYEQTARGEDDEDEE